jgi:hypothetical protein
LRDAAENGQRGIRDGIAPAGPHRRDRGGGTAAAVEAFLTKRGYRIAPVSMDYRDYSFAIPYARMLRSGDQAGADQILTTVLKTLDDSFARCEARSTEILGYELPQTLLIHCNEMNARTLSRLLKKSATPRSCGSS